jgi:translation initiation factor IF-3
MPGYKYRLIDTASSEIGIVTLDRARIAEGDLVTLPDGRETPVIEVYDDEEHGKEGGVEATLVVDDEA